MLKHNKKLQKAFKHLKKTGDATALAEELKKQAHSADNKDFVTVI